VTIASHSETAEGHGVAVLNGKKQALSAGDFLRLPPETKHGFITKSTSLIMLHIRSPGSRPDHDVYFESILPE